MNFLSKSYLVLLISIFVLTIYSHNSFAAVGTISTVDTNYFIEDANINIRGTGWTGADRNVALRIWDPVRDLNFWSGIDFNIMDNNSSSVRCDENVYFLSRPDANLGSNPLLADAFGNGASSDYNGAYLSAPVAGAACKGNTGTFDVNAQIPLGMSKGLAYVYAHTFTSPSISTTSFSNSQIVYITPYLQILGWGIGNGTRVNNRLNRPYGAADTNIMIRGIGFPIDSNVSFKWVSGSTTIDLNISDDGNGTVFSTLACTGTGICGDFNSARTTAFDDGNYVTIDSNFVAERSTTNGASDNNAWGFYNNGVDRVTRTGGFDINVLVPRNGGFLTQNNIDFNVNTKIIDTNRFTNVNMKSKFLNGADANFVITPSLLAPITNYQVKVLYSGAWVDMNQAFSDGNIANMQAVRFWIRSLTTANSGSNVGDFNIVMNSDMNLLAGGRLRGYDGNFTTGRGTAGINTAQMPEFKIDANITMFNVKSTGAMPRLARDNIPCGSICTNVDGTTLSSGGTDVYGNTTWTYNSTAKDGNLFFRVSTFSTFTALNSTLTVLGPNGGETLHQTNNLGGASGDGNAVITFNYSDMNESEKQLYVNIYFSDTNGQNKTLIVQDLNLFDNKLITCTDGDSNIATTNSCTIDWNIGGINPGVYWLDINMFEYNGALDQNRWVEDSSDKNFTVNAPIIRMTDPFLTTEKSTILGKNSLGADTRDANIWFTLDFNVFYPNDRNVLRDLNNLHIFFDYDTNALNGVDGNFVDGNANARNNANNVRSSPGKFYSALDLNLADYGNTIIGDTNTQKDMNFTFDINMISTKSTGIKGAWYVRIDANAGTAYSPYKVFFNDKRPVSRITLPGTNAPSTTRYLRGSAARIDFNVMDPDAYDYNKLDGNFLFADIYLDSDSNGANGFGTNIINDLNLASGSGTSRVCFQDLNGSGAGTTGNADQNSAVDANCTRTFNSTSVSDGNYFIAIDLNEGSSTTGPGTRATDYNYSDFNIVIDNTAPSVTTSNLTTNSSSPSIEYTATDIYGVNAVYIRRDGGAWVNNGNNKTNYTFGALGLGNHYFDVNAVDNAGNETKSSGIITISGSSGNGGSEGGNGGGAGGGTGGGSGSQTPTETPITTTPATPDTITTILTEAGLPADTAATITEADALTSAATSYSIASNKTTITQTITNTSDKILKDIVAIINVPKNIAQTSDNISSTQAFEVLNKDPILKAAFPLINPGNSASFSYTVNKKLGSSAFTNLIDPLIVSFKAEAVDACKNVSCNDNNPCTSDSCSAGKCSNKTLANGIVCGANNVCQAGNCTAQTPRTPTGGAAAEIPTPTGGIDSTLLAIGILVIIIIVGIVLWQSKKGKDKGWRA